MLERCPISCTKYGGRELIMLSNEVCVCGEKEFLKSIRVGHAISMDMHFISFLYYLLSG